MDKNTVIWDLGGTLIEPSTEYCQQLQKRYLSLLFHLYASNKAPSQYDLIALDLLYALGTQHGPETELIRLPTGMAAPAIICSWLAGTITGHAIIAQAMGQYPYSKKSQNTAKEKYIVRKLLTTLFDPYVLACCMAPVSATLHLVARCARNSSNQLYILSNWDKESFAVLYNSYHGHKVIRYFKRTHIVISADTGFVKPQHQIYDYFFSTYGLQPEACILIDNQKENIAVAQDYGMTAFLFTNASIPALEAELKALNIF
jgi:phosphoglycolate phosphatase-like HAD superfamily hydrolase